MSLLTARGTVHTWHCDHMGHMNVMWYVGKFDDATWNFLAAAGLTPAYLRNNHRGAVAVDQRIAYRSELRAGDTLTIRTAGLELGRSSFKFVHEMINDATGALAAVTILKGVHIDTDQRASCPLPDEVRRGFEALIAADTGLWSDWPPARGYLTELALDRSQCR